MKRGFNRSHKLMRRIRHVGMSFCWLVMVMVLSRPAAAQGGCDAILKDGAFNFMSTDAQKSVQDDLYEWLKTTDWTQFSKAQNQGLKVGFPINNVPIEISGTNSQSEFQEWQRSVDQGRIRNFSSEEFLQIVSRTASPEIVAAWLDCIHASSVGLVCSHTVSGISNATVTFKWGPNSSSDFSPLVLSPNGIQITGAKLPSGFGPGSEVPIGGTTLLLKRDSPTSDIVIALSTTKGSCTRYIPAIADTTVPVSDLPKFNIKTFQATSAIANHPEVRLTVPPGYHIISGGCRDNYKGWGNMIWASYPESDQVWVCKGKDHRVGDPSTIDAIVVALEDPKNEWIVTIASATSGVSAVPEITATLSQGFTMTGCGGVVNFTGYGQLLTAVYPEGLRSCVVKAKQHGVWDLATATAYIIGVQPRNGADMPQPTIFQVKSAVANHPSTSVAVDTGYIRVGCGAFADWHVNGSLLTSLFPSGDDGCVVSSKDHDYAEATSIVGYAIGLKFTPKTCSYLIGPDNFTVESGATSGNISVQTSNGCPVNVATGEYWLHPDPLGQLTGYQSITLRIDPNSTPLERTGFVSVAGRSIAVTQLAAATCTGFTVRLSQTEFPSGGGVTNAQIIGQPGCQSSAQTTADFISFRPSSFVGSGNTEMFVFPNKDSAAKTSKVTIAGITFQISLAGSASGTAPSVPNPDAAAVSGLTHIAKWYYFQTASGQWVLAQANTVASPGVNTALPVLLLKGIDPSGKEIAWKPLQNYPSVFNYPSAGTTFSTVTVSPDGRTISFGDLVSTTSDSDLSQLARKSYQTQWLYFSINQDRDWYIAEANPTVASDAAVLMLKGVDPAVDGKLIWEPIQNYPAVGKFPAAGRQFDSLAISADRKAIAVGPIKQ